MIMNEKEETKCPRSGGMGENTPFTKQSKEKGAGQGSRHPLKKENTATNVNYFYS